MTTRKFRGIIMGFYSAALMLGTTGVILPRTAAALTHSADSDHDGLSNRVERRLGTDPHNADTDGDGLSDGEEVLYLGTDPLSADTDGDGVSDGVEVQNGTDPLDPEDGGSADNGQGTTDTAGAPQPESRR